MMRRFLLGLPLALLLVLADRAPAAPPRAKTFAIPITVSTTAAKRRNWPVNTGVPFPRGQLRDDAQLAVRSGSSQRAVQMKPLAHWPDGSVRWALVDWQVDEGADRQQRFELVPAGKATAATGRVRITDDKAKVTVDTGPLRFSIPRQRFAVLDEVSVRGKPALAGSVGTVLITDEKELEPQPPTSVRVLESGPLRARIELRGAYGQSFQYVIRIDAFADQPWVRVLHTFEQHDNRFYLPLRNIELTLPIGGKSVRYSAGINDGSPRTGTVDAGIWRLVQVDNATIAENGNEQARQAAGWLAATHERGRVTIAAPYFWQEYPQGFTIQPGKIVYDMLAADARAIPIGMGAAKTHELVLGFDDGSTPQPLWLDELAHPLVAAVDAEWIDASHALRNSVGPATAGAAFLGNITDGFRRIVQRNAKERWDDTGDVRCVGDENPRTGAFGMLNWGDWNYPGFHDDTKGCDAWGNLEYDLTQVAALGFAATGNPEIHDAMVVAGRHFMDVDVVHYQSQRRDWLGMNHPKNPLHFAFELGGVDLGHTWTEGLFSLYYLTGDERARAAAVGIADYLEQRTRKGVTFGNPRQYGWPQIALVAAYEATGDKKYREAAVWYADHGRNAFAADQIDDWKMGILAEALTYTHSIAPSPAINAWLSSYGEAVRTKGARDPRYFPALAYIGKLNANRELSRLAERTAQALLFGSWAKPFTIAARTGFAIYGMQAPPAPQPPNPPLAKGYPRRRR